MPTDTWKVTLRCESQDDPLETVVIMAPGYSKAGPCVVVNARNVLGDMNSETVTRGYPADCVALPEPPVSWAVALLAVIPLWRGRARRRTRAPV